MYSGKKSLSWILAGWVASDCKIFQLQIKLVQLIHCYQEVKLKMYLFLVEVIRIAMISISPQRVCNEIPHT